MALICQGFCKDGCGSHLFSQTSPSFSFTVALWQLASVWKEPKLRSPRHLASCVCSSGGWWEIFPCAINLYICTYDRLISLRGRVIRDLFFFPNMYHNDCVVYDSYFNCLVFVQSCMLMQRGRGRTEGHQRISWALWKLHAFCPVFFFLNEFMAGLIMFNVKFWSTESLLMHFSNRHFQKQAWSGFYDLNDCIVIKSQNFF